MPVNIERRLTRLDVLVDVSVDDDKSENIAVGSAAWGSFQTPGAFTTTSVTVEYSNDGTNWTTVPTLSHESNPITVTTDSTYYIPALAFTAAFVRLALGSNEGADRTIKVVLKG